MALVLLKALLVRYDPQWSGRPVIEWTIWEPWQMVLIYIPISFAQEAMGRGFTQTCIERLLTGNRRKRLAIVLASAEFGAMHLHYSFGMGMIAFAGSIFLGVLYARHRTLVGVILCHYVLGQLIFGPLQLMR